jgi:hypothetical protein
VACFLRFFVQSDDILYRDMLYRLSLDILYTPVREQNRGVGV